MALSRAERDDLLRRVAEIEAELDDLPGGAMTIAERAKKLKELSQELLELNGKLRG
jgi:cell division protein FtsB